MFFWIFLKIYVTNPLCILVFLIIHSFFINLLYVERLKENAGQLKIQKMISEFSTDFLNVNAVNFDQKTSQWLEKSGKLFNISRACACFFDDDKKTMSCQYEWCNQGVKAVSEFCMALWYDQDIQNDVLGLRQDEFYKYLNNL